MIQPCEIENGEYNSLEELNKFIDSRIEKLQKNLMKYECLKEEIENEINN